jgi:tRNA-specific 2-thiouridylase
VRAHGDSLPAVAAVVGDELVVKLREPVFGVAPGQTAVVYVGTRVLGQTTIDRTVSADADSAVGADSAAASDAPSLVG